MKLTKLAKSSGATRQMMQPLESRRLMSLSAGVEFPPAGGPPVDGGQIVHSFGFEPANPGADAVDGAGSAGFGFGGDAGPTPMPIPISVPVPGFESEPFAQQLSHAIAIGSPISITPSDTAPAAVVSLSALYSELPNSTVVEIGSANVHAATRVLVQSLIDRIDSALTNSAVESAVAESQLTTAAPQLSRIDSSWKSPGITSGKALGAALSIMPVPVAAGADVAICSSKTPAAPTWNDLHCLEQELTAVRLFSTQVLGEFARDGAIALSHLESATISAIESVESSVESSAASIVSQADWRSLVAVAAAVAAVAYVQSETHPDQTPGESVFSNRLIQPLMG